MADGGVAAHAAPVLRPALRYHGGKFRLAPWIIGFFPPHDRYVESFGGGAGVLLQKPASRAEIYNDLDSEIVNFFRVLRDPVSRQALVEACRLTPYARDEFELAWHTVDDPIEGARRTAIRAQMGFGSAGAVKGHTGFRIDTARRTTSQHDWLSYPAAIAAAGERLAAAVVVENRPALSVMEQHDSPTTLHFVDPPYVHSTRVLRSKGGYRHEMTDADHEALLDGVQKLQGMVVLCGYANALYDRRLSAWSRHSTGSRISSSRGTTVRTEVLWLNQACTAAMGLSQLSLFGAVEPLPGSTSTTKACP